MKSIVFLGAGRITAALCAGLRLNGYDGRLVAHDRNPDKLVALRRESRVEIARGLKSGVDAASLVIVAVRPASVQGLLREVKACGASPRLCVSLAAGVPLRKLRETLPFSRWVRAMPSPVCRVGCGLTGLCSDRRVPTKDRLLVREFFAAVGHVVEVPEQQFDVFTATYSSSHGYHALAALADAAQREGLDRKTASIAAAHALADGIAYWRESGLSVEELLEEAATPGGIAAATMTAMDRGGYRRVVAKGLNAGITQARRNATR